MNRIPICESFLGRHFKQWYESDDPLAKDHPVRRVICYAVYNDLTDELTQRLQDWVKAGFPHVCPSQGYSSYT